jgi:hypothetical protein
VSVGHVARAFEEAGLVTVAIYIEAFAHYAEAMRLPRTLVTPHPMGRPIGPPGDAARHAEVVAAALDLAESATEPGTLVRLGGAYRPGAIGT